MARAARAISLLAERVAQGDDRVVYMPMICWMSGSTEPGFIPGPCLAFHEAHRVPRELVVEAHNVKVGFQIPEAILAPHRDSALDFIGDTFVFVPRSAIKFMGQD